MQSEERRKNSQELGNNGVLHLRRLIAKDDIELLRVRLQCETIKTRLQALDRDCLVQEVEWLTKLDPVFRDSNVYQRCYEVACKLFNGKCYFGFDHAIVKAPGSGPVHWHQDQFYSRVDRDKQCLAFWIPLQAVTPESGGMEYATGLSKGLLKHEPLFENSHAYRVVDLPPVKTTSPTMDIGDVCIHTPMTLHRSHPNQSEKPRAAWILQFNRYGMRRFFRLSSIRRHLSRDKN